MRTRSGTTCPCSSALYNLRVDWQKRSEKKEDAGSSPEGKEEGAGPSRDVPEEQILCGILVVLRRQREMARKIGGWYFKDRNGEDIVAGAWRIFFPRAEVWLRRTELNSILERLEPQDNSVEAQRRLNREPSAASSQQELQTGFRSWVDIGEFRHVISLLHVLETVLDFEMNRPYELWYGSKEKFQISDFDPKIRALAAWQPSGEPKLSADLKGLLKLLRRYRAKSCGRWSRTWNRIRRYEGRPLEKG